MMGFLGSALVLVALAVRALEPRPRAAAAAALALAFVPVAGIPLAGYLRAGISDLSVTSIVLLIGWTWGRLAGTPPILDGASRWLLRGCAVSGLFLYPMALGVGPFDPYALGFAPSVLLGVLALAAAFAWWQRALPVYSALLAVVAAYGLDLMESANLWDYLLDPWLWLYSIYDLRPWRRKS